MEISYDKLVFADHVKSLVREVTDGVPSAEIPGSWDCFLVFHPATRTFYSSKSNAVLVYEEVIRKRLSPRWDSIAIALRRMLERNSAFQFFVFSKTARPTVEHWLNSQGFSRIATKMGEGVSPHRVLFRVYSHENKIMRFVSAPSNTSELEVIAQANKSFKTWLASTSGINRHERTTMRVATRSKTVANSSVFEATSVVTPTALFDGRPVREYRSLCMEYNLNSIKTFIANTTF